MKAGRVHIFLISVLGAVAVFSQGQVSIESKVDHAKINIGDVVKYTVTITHDADVKLERPSPGKNLGQFEIREYNVREPQTIGNQVITEADYFISTFDVGDFEIPSLQVYYRLANDTTLHQLKTEIIKIKVASLNPNEKGDIRDIKPPMTPPRDLARIALMICGAFIAMALLGLGYWYYQRRKRGEPILPTREKPLRPAHELALEALAELEQSDLLATGQVKLYYIQVSEILRQYVERRYFIDAMEMTTLQLVTRMETDRIPLEHISALQSILQLSDLVKFAKYVPSEDIQRRAVAQASAFVNNTKLVLMEPATIPVEEAAPIMVTSEKEA